MPPSTIRRRTEKSLCPPPSPDAHALSNKEPEMISDRTEVTQLIRAAKLRKKLKWTDVAKAVGMSKEWTTAACLGQMTFTKDQAEKLGALFELPEEAVAL